MASSLPKTERSLVRQPSGIAVANYVRELIFEGHLGEGERVPQQQIASQLGVSSIPVRDGMLILEREGFIGAGI